jgi:hypothetical protein
VKTLSCMLGVWERVKTLSRAKNTVVVISCCQPSPSVPPSIRSRCMSPSMSFSPLVPPFCAHPVASCRDRLDQNAETRVSTPFVNA